MDLQPHQSRVSRWCVGLGPSCWGWDRPVHQHPCSLPTRRSCTPNASGCCPMFLGGQAAWLRSTALSPPYLLKADCPPAAALLQRPRAGLQTAAGPARVAVPPGAHSTPLSSPGVRTVTLPALAAVPRTERRGQVPRTHWEWLVTVTPASSQQHGVLADWGRRQVSGERSSARLQRDRASRNAPHTRLGMPPARVRWGVCRPRLCPLPSTVPPTHAWWLRGSPGSIVRLPAPRFPRLALAGTGHSMCYCHRPVCRGARAGRGPCPQPC